MAEVIQLDLTVDADQLAEVGKDYMADALPGWQPAPGNPETVLIEAAAYMLAEVAEQAALTPPAVYLTIAQTIYGIARAPATFATGTASFTWDASTPAMTLHAGTQILAPTPYGESALFSTLSDMLAPVGGGVTTSIVEAEDSGPEMNGAFGPCELVEDVDGITAVTLAATIGGGDAESDDAYLQRVTDLLRVLAPRPILPEDHAALAMEVAGVGRVMVLNLYQPGTADRDAGKAVGDWVTGHPVNAQTNIPRCTTVVITRPDGTAPDTALMTRVYDTLDANREVNFLNYVMKPDYTAVDVTAVVVAYPGTNKNDAAAAAAAKMSEWLASTSWGSQQDAEPTQSWPKETKARLYEAVDWLNRGAGVWYVKTVTLGKNGGAQTAADVTLGGNAPITSTGIVVVTGEDAPP